ncbi:unnamed protein product [Paramecium sonneborni]|uniref:Calpain catalytic domain-containing protein n=1 Tax=Paramecium sonneborni TaxID=65129 RepID=A0A8S1R8Z2_9CILI|nr:unnamed protein product [Paramecium sonneborni]
MYYQNKQKYDEEIKTFQEADKNQYNDATFNEKNRDKNLELTSLAKLEQIEKSYYQDFEMKESLFYKSFALTNAFFIVQQKMSSLKYHLEQREDEQLFGVWLWQQGEQHLIIVDDKIPCIQKQDGYELATVRSKYQWPIILQKAIGKLLGYGYDSFNLIQNDSIEFFTEIITGSIIIEQEFQSIEELEAKSRDKSIIVFVKYTQEQKTIAYQIEVKEKKLINLIPPNQKSIFVKGSQLNWEEFKQNFKTVHIVIWKDDYRVTSVSLKNQIERQSDFIEHTYLYKFKIDHHADYQITIWQKDYIINEEQIEILNKNSRQKLGLIRILLFKEFKPNQYQFIDGNCDFLANLSINQKLDVGEYYILCQGYFNFLKNQSQEEQQKQKKLNLTIKGLNIPEIVNSDDQVESKLIRLISSFIKNQASINNTRSIIQPEIQVTTDKAYGFLYFYYENKGTIDIYEEVNIKEQGHLISYDSLIKQSFFQVQVQQKHFQVVLYTLDPKIIQKNESLKFVYEYTHKILDEQQYQKNKLLQDSKQRNIQCNQIKISINQHEQGIFIQFQNFSDQDNQVDLIFTELKNLSLVLNKDFNIQKNQINFSIQKKSKLMMFFDVIVPNSPYYYKWNINCSTQN